MAGVDDDESARTTALWNARALLVPFPTSWFSPLVVAACLLFTAAPFLVLGLGIQAAFFHRLRLGRHHLPVAAIGSVCMLGYAILWISLLSPTAGRLASLATWCAALALLLERRSRTRMLAVLRDADVHWPLLLLMTTAFVSLSLGLAILPEPLPHDWVWGNTVRSRFKMYPDDVFPLAMAQRILTDRELAKDLMGQMSVERGPLQAGLVLLQLPVWDFASRALSDDTRWTLALYRSFAAMLQCTWIAAGFAVLRGMRLSLRGSLALLGALAPSYFFLLNTLFTWPKLLAGGLVVAVYAVLLQRAGMPRRPDRVHMIYGAALAALGSLAHPGASTTLLAFALLLLSPSRRPRWRDVALSAALAACVVAPWSAVQNALLKDPAFLARRHLAGVARNDPRGTLEAIRETYARFTLGSYLSHQLKQMEVIIGVSDASGFLVDRGAGLPERVRDLHRFSMGADLGLLNLGWIAWIGAGLLLRGPLRSRWRSCAGCLLAGLAAVGIWLLVQVSIAVTYHGSYATFILLFLGLAGVLSCLPRLAAVPVLAAHAGGSLAIALLGWPEPLRLVPVQLVGAGLAVSAFAAALEIDRRAAPLRST